MQRPGRRRVTVAPANDRPSTASRWIRVTLSVGLCVAAASYPWIGGNVRQSLPMALGAGGLIAGLLSPRRDRHGWHVPHVAALGFLVPFGAALPGLWDRQWVVQSALPSRFDVLPAIATVALGVFAVAGRNRTTVAGCRGALRVRRVGVIELVAGAAAVVIAVSR